MGDLSVGRKAGIQRGRCNELPKPLLRHHMEAETCMGGLCEPLFTQGLEEK